MNSFRLPSSDDPVFHRAGEYFLFLWGGDSLGSFSKEAEVGLRNVGRVYKWLKTQKPHGPNP